MKKITVNTLEEFEEKIAQHLDANTPVTVSIEYDEDENVAIKEPLNLSTEKIVFIEYIWEIINERWLPSHKTERTVEKRSNCLEKITEISYKWDCDYDYWLPSRRTERTVECVQ